MVQPYTPATGVRVGPALSEEAKAKLKAEYFACLEQPATETLDTFPSDQVTLSYPNIFTNSKYFPHVQVTAVLDGKGWIVPCLLSEEECEQLITLGEEFGIGEEDFKASIYYPLSTIF